MHLRVIYTQNKMQLRSGRSISTKTIQENKPMYSSMVMEVKNKNMVLRSGLIIKAIPEHETFKITTNQMKYLILNRINVVLEIQKKNNNDLNYYIEMSRGIIELYSFLNDNSTLIVKTLGKSNVQRLSKIIIEKAEEFMTNQTLKVLSRTLRDHPDGKLIKNCMIELKNTVFIYSSMA
jgi:hypothetical protein